MESNEITQNTEEQARPGESAQQMKEPQYDVQIGQIRERVTEIFHRLDAGSKLAILLFFELDRLQGLNFDQNQPAGQTLFDMIYDELAAACLKDFENADSQWLYGVWQGFRLVNRCTA